MPNIASSIRMLRTDVKRTARNKAIRTECKSSITKAEKKISAGDADEAKLQPSMPSPRWIKLQVRVLFIPIMLPAAKPVWLRN